LHNGRKPTIRLNIISQCLCVHGLITTSTWLGKFNLPSSWLW
jgi:hypothetical protein